MYKRQVHRAGQKEIYEKADFQKNTARRYDAVIEEFAKKEAMNIITLDASRPIEETAEKIWSYFENLPILKS